MHQAAVHGDSMYVCMHEPWDRTVHACINQDKPVVGILAVGILSGWDFVRWDVVLAPLIYVSY